MNRPSEPRTVTAPVSGRKVRLPAATGILNGMACDFMNLSRSNLLAVDAQMTGIDFGYVQLKIAHGRLAGFTASRDTKVLDDLVGQPPPRVKAGVA